MEEVVTSDPAVAEEAGEDDGCVRGIKGKQTGISPKFTQDFVLSIPNFTSF
jgi:hypothetical protein